MLTDQQSKLELSPRDYFQMMATPENGLSELATVFEEQENILNENESSNSSLFDSLTELKEFDPDIYLEVMDTLAELVKSKKISAADIPKLVSRFKTANDAPSETLKQYGSEKGAMAWHNFTVTIYGELKAKDSEGNLIQNISHHLNHEIGHSLLEIDAISIEDARTIFEGIDTEFESGHIKRLEAASASEDLMLRERFAELAGIFLRTNSQAEFYQNRMDNCPANVQKEIVTNSDKFQSETVELYKRIVTIWPQIQKALEGIDLEEHIRTTELLDESEGEGELEDQIVTEQIEEPAEGVESAPDSPSTESDGGAEHNESKKSAKSFTETPELAKKQKTDPTTVETIKQLAQAFGELDIFFGNQQ